MIKVLLLNRCVPSKLGVLGEVAGRCHVLQCLKHGGDVAGVELLLIYFVFIKDLVDNLLLFLVDLVDTDGSEFDIVVVEDFFVD